MSRVSNGVRRKRDFAGAVTGPGVERGEGKAVEVGEARPNGGNVPAEVAFDFDFVTDGESSASDRTGPGSTAIDVAGGRDGGSGTGEAWSPEDMECSGAKNAVLSDETG